MCPPVIAAAAPLFAGMTTVQGATLGLAAAGTAVSTMGAIRSGQAQAASARYQGQVADINASYADRAARDALDRGELDALAHAREVAALRGKQTAGMAAQGLELGYGTPLDIAKETSVLAAEDRARIYRNAENEAQSFRINAQSFRNRSAGARAEAGNARTAGLINAGSTFLEGAAKTGGIWAKYGN